MAKVKAKSKIKKWHIGLFVTLAIILIIVILVVVAITSLKKAFKNIITEPAIALVTDAYLADDGEIMYYYCFSSISPMTPPINADNANCDISAMSESSLALSVGDYINIKYDKSVPQLTEIISKYNR